MEEEEQQKKKKKPNSKYNYTFGDMYPGVIIGHKTCNPFKGASTTPCAGFYGLARAGAGGGSWGVGGGSWGVGGGSWGVWGGSWGVGGAAGARGAVGAGGGIGAVGAGGGIGAIGRPGAPGAPGALGALGAPGAPGVLGQAFPSKFAMTPAYPRVPANMGWLWNASDVPGMKKPRRGWSPGVIGKSVAKLMHFKCPRGGHEKDKKKKKGKKKSKHGGIDVGGGDSEGEEQVVLKPTLKIQRKGNVFTIEVNPLKDLTEIAPNEDPYVDCDPMVFTIIKKRSPEEMAKMEARKMIKLKRERDEEIRKCLTEAVEDICKCAYMDIYCNDLTALDKVINKCPAFQERECICEEESMSSLSSGATWDFEYTPPFGCVDPTPKKRIHYIHVGTQYSAADAGIPEPPPPCCKSQNAQPKTDNKKKCLVPCKKT